ncbi:hypothetical protein NPIL_299521 [Nephila pilipes]|uniref:Uncharacterized protein n=1 Tax=Nephila pilipes TaxID=299642 RepID=A0A8X6T3U7_NEPPI|nr:hypothetical protein NPIL_299521 [Nephila pilipes]
MCIQLILFLNSKHSKTYFCEIASVWTNYFERGLKKRFEKAGGFSKLRATGLVYKKYDCWYTDFILKKCIPCGAKSGIQKSLLDVEKKEFIDYNKICPKFTFSATDKSSVQEESIDDWMSTLPVHERLGIVPHELILNALNPFVFKTPPPTPDICSYSEAYLKCEKYSKYDDTDSTKNVERDEQKFLTTPSIESVEPGFTVRQRNKTSLKDISNDVQKMTKLYHAELDNDEFSKGERLKFRIKQRKEAIRKKNIRGKRVILK